MEGEYYDGQFMCQLCDGNCRTCSMDARNCTSCVEPWVLGYGFVCGCETDKYNLRLANGTDVCLLCLSAIMGC